jgi:hypothetical protein
MTTVTQSLDTLEQETKKLAPQFRIHSIVYYVDVPDDALVLILRYMGSLGASPTKASVAKISTAREIKEFHIGDKKHFRNLLFCPTSSSEPQFHYGNMCYEVLQ